MRWPRRTAPWVGQAHQAAVAQHRRAEQEIAVADHAGQAAVARGLGQHVDAASLEGQGACIVADPDIEQVAEHEDGVGGGLPQVDRPGLEGAPGSASLRWRSEMKSDGIPGAWRGEFEVSRQRPGRRWAGCRCAAGRHQRHLDGPLDAHVFQRHVVVEALAAGAHVLDLVQHLGTLHDAAEYRIAPTLGILGAEVE